MARTVADMTTDELRQLVGDPDEGLELRADIRKRLLRQKRSVEKGERGEPLEAVIQRLKLA